MEKKRRNRRKQILGLTERLSLESARLRERARALGPCQARETMMRKARQMDDARAMAEFLKAPVVGV